MSTDPDDLPTSPAELLPRVKDRGQAIRRRNKQLHQFRALATIVLVCGVVALAVRLPSDDDVTTTPPTTTTGIGPRVTTPDPGALPQTPVTDATTATTPDPSATPSSEVEVPIATVGLPPSASHPRQLPTIAFVRPGNVGNDIMVVPAGATDAVRLITGSPFLNATAPAVSPDGSRLAVASTRDSLTNGVRSAFDIWVMDIDGSDQRQITYTNDLEGYGPSFPAWSPDGTRIAYTAPATDGSEPLWVIDADGGGRRRVTPARVNALDARWSPDGSQLSYIVLLGADSELHLVDVATGADRMVARSVGPASWSADGRSLLFEGRTADGRSELIVHDLPSGSERVLNLGPNAYAPRFCGPGDQLTYFLDNDGPGPAPSTLIAAGLDGSRSTPVPAVGGLTAPQNIACAES